MIGCGEGWRASGGSLGELDQRRGSFLMDSSRKREKSHGENGGVISSNKCDGDGWAKVTCLVFWD
jgi:hypothetical protein